MLCELHGIGAMAVTMQLSGKTLTLVYVYPSIFHFEF